MDSSAVWCCFVLFADVVGFAVLFGFMYFVLVSLRFVWLCTGFGRSFGVMCNVGHLSNTRASIFPNELRPTSAHSYINKSVSQLNEEPRLPDGIASNAVGQTGFLVKLRDTFVDVRMRRRWPELIWENRSACV
jgi:hypothetical protein